MPAKPKTVKKTKAATRSAEKQKAAAKKTAAPRQAKAAKAAKKTSAKAPQAEQRPVPEGSVAVVNAENQRITDAVLHPEVFSVPVNQHLL